MLNSTNFIEKEEKKTIESIWNNSRFLFLSSFSLNFSEDSMVNTQIFSTRKDPYIAHLIPHNSRNHTHSTHVWFEKKIFYTHSNNIRKISLTKLFFFICFVRFQFLLIYICVAFSTSKIQYSILKSEHYFVAMLFLFWI